MSTLFLLKNNIHTSMAKTFYSDVLSQRDVYYYFLGRVLSWGAGDVAPDVVNTFDSEIDVRNNLVFMKKISSGDVSFVIRRIDWTSGVVYDRCDSNISPSNLSFSGASDITSATFYVLTDEMNVYKCISNNANSPSTMKPTGIEYDVITLGDGYIWKYMYSIPPSLQYRFLTEAYIPVITALQLRYYNNLGIDSVTINSGGSGYSGESAVTANVSGDGVSATISLSIEPSTGSIVKVRIKTPGSGYTAGTINIVDTLSTGTGKFAGNATAILTPHFSGGKLIDVTLTDPGLNYSTSNQTTITVNGSGSGAIIYPVIEAGAIVDVIISSAGSGYSSASLTVEGAGSGAILSVSSGAGDIDSIQSDVELLANPGAVYVVDPVNKGTGYTYASCSVVGDGTGLQITPNVVNNIITHYTVNSNGTGYTWAQITVSGNGTGATCKAVFSPIAGHGHNAVDELYASNIMFYTTVKYEANQGMLVDNTYRQFGVIKNPSVFANTNTYRGVTASTCYLVQVQDASSYVIDTQLSLVADLTKVYTIIATDNLTKILLQDMSHHVLHQGDQLVRVADSLTTTVQSVAYPDVSKTSGEIIFVDNRVSIHQTNNQYVSLRTTLKF